MSCRQVYRTHNTYLVQDRNTGCTYPESRRGKRKDTRVATGSLEDRLERMEFLIQMQRNVQSPSEHTVPVSNAGGTIIAPIARHEQTVHATGVDMSAALIEEQAKRQDVATDPRMGVGFMVDRNPGPSHTQGVFSPTPGTAIGPSHSISPLETQIFSNPAQQRSLVDPPSAHHGANDTEASVLAPQLVGEISSHCII